MAASAREPQLVHTEMQPLAGAAQALYGLHFSDAHVADLARKVTWLSLATMAVVIITSMLAALSAHDTLESFSDWMGCSDEDYDDCQILVDVLGGMLYSAIAVSFCAGFCVPCCGYQGARTNNRNMMCCFCGWNLLDAIIGFGFMWVVICGTLAGVVLPLYIYPFVVLFCLWGGSFWYGNKLYSHLGQGRVITLAPVYPVMTAVQVQPGYPAYPAQPVYEAYPAQPGYPAYPAQPGYAASAPAQPGYTASAPVQPGGPVAAA